MVRISSGESAPETSSAAATVDLDCHGMPRVSSSGAGHVRTRSKSDTLQVGWLPVPIPRSTRSGLLRATLRLTASHSGVSHTTSILTETSLTSSELQSRSTHARDMARLELLALSVPKGSY